MVSEKKRTLIHRWMFFPAGFCRVLSADLALLTSRLKSLVAEIKILLHVLYELHGLVHQLDTDIFQEGSVYLQEFFP